LLLWRLRGFRRRRQRIHPDAAGDSSGSTPRSGAVELTRRRPR
jgi:hypothetical protein